MFRNKKVFFSFIVAYLEYISSAKGKSNVLAW